MGTPAAGVIEAQVGPIPIRLPEPVARRRRSESWGQASPPSASPAPTMGNSTNGSPSTSPGPNVMYSGSAPTSLRTFGGLPARYAAWKQSTRAFRAMRSDPPKSSSLASPPIFNATVTGPLEPLDTLVPSALRAGEVMLKVTQNKVAERTFRVDAESTCIVWDSKRGNSVPLYAIRDVRIGDTAQSYRHALQISDAHEPRWISIIYQAERGYKAVHVVALSDESLQRWRDTLLRILAQWQAMTSGRVAASRAQSDWLEASWLHSSQALDLPAVQRLCQRMGLQVAPSEISVLFSQADREHAGVLHFDAFQQFVTLLKRRADLEALFAQWAENDVLSYESFVTFLRQEQGEFGWSDATIARLYHRYHVAHVDGFIAFLTSRDNATPAPRPVHGVFPVDATMRLDEPLSHYYISSSHNTYLEGGQWKGDSTVEGYVRALQQGARSVELDCWDGPNGQPQVTHGHTLTGRVPLDDVVAAIAQYAFVTSPYPLILSLEVHNDVAQQITLAHILRSRLGEMLVTAPLPDVVPGNLPSPEQLRYRILVKCKNYELVPTSTMPDNEDHSDSSSAYSTTSSTISASASTGSESDSLLERTLVRLARHRRSAPEVKSRPMAQELVSLLIYTVGVPCRGLNKKEVYDIEHMISLSERKARRLIRESATALIKHNLTHLTRVYPSMTKLSRVTSSANFAPTDMWAAGCQLVALNWQTRDAGMAQNLALFAGSPGYVLKPEALRLRSHVKNAPGSVLVRTALTIVSGQQLPCRQREEAATCPFVSVHLETPALWGTQEKVTLATPTAATTTSRLSMRTPTVLSNGLAPQWHTTCYLDVPVPLGLDSAAWLAQRSRHASAEHQAIVLHEATRGQLDLCLVHLQVWDDQPNGPVLIARRTISLGRLGRGHRHVALHDAQLAPMLYASLCIHTSHTLVGETTPPTVPTTKAS
ncbi:phosphatidylinositol phospholipase C [Malassezia pachydermatis]|uniref:Phosphoinositide phospholipase C n=1 Tax=Malassezia pachydermatis TaxID=77020 RepID=A0A0M8MHP4_9BASI|nr:plc-like phosphodiesterase [Malassezia pachydermatis]KOS12676.1 plc-like phosphodiesterase [Malassezia pachydermatis]